jgi:hypothetical protein
MRVHETMFDLGLGLSLGSTELQDVVDPGEDG